MLITGTVLILIGWLFAVAGGDKIVGLIIFVCGFLIFLLRLVLEQFSIEVPEHMKTQGKAQKLGTIGFVTTAIFALFGFTGFSERIATFGFYIGIAIMGIAIVIIVGTLLGKK